MKLKLLVFFGILALGVVTSTILLTKCRPGDTRTIVEPIANSPSGKNPGETNTNKKTDPSGSGSANGGSKKLVSTPGNRPSTDPANQATTKGGSADAGTSLTTDKPAMFRTGTKTAEGVVSSVANSIVKKDFNALTAATGDTIPESAKQRIKEMVEDPNLKLDPDRPFWEVAKSRDSVRWMLNFVPKTEGDGQPKTVVMDLVKDAQGNYSVKKVILPPSVKEIAMAVNKNSGEPASDEGDNGGIDSLTVAQAFSSAVLNEDFVSARQLTSGKVTDERIAGLMIALEEGKFTLREDRPLIVTFARDHVAWVLSRVYSSQQTSEFALALEREGSWKVNGLTFGKVIASLAKDADATYSPIVEDPSGGESLVVYFDFDEAGLTSRADSQLRIVANILKQDINRKIRITGHADALGSDDYNSQLSNQRAQSIRDAIIERGAAPSQVITEGYGETKPRKPNFKEDGSDNPTGRSLNRRAEVYLDF